MADSTCGEELVATTEFQTLKSKPVMANDNCAWRIKTPNGERIEMKVDYISFPCTDSCSSYVEIKYDKVKTATGIWNSYISIVDFFRCSPLLQCPEQLDYLRRRRYRYDHEGRTESLYWISWICRSLQNMFVLGPLTRGGDEYKKTERQKT